MRCALVLAFLALFPARAQNLPVASRQQDLDYVATQIPRLHPNFFYQLDRGAFQSAADALRAKIGTLTDAEFLVQLAALISMAGDAHTSISLSGSAASEAIYHNEFGQLVHMVSRLHPHRIPFTRLMPGTFLVESVWPFVYIRLSNSF